MKKIAIITGASRGIGAAVAEALAQDGYHTVLLARHAEDLHAVAAKIRAAGGASSAFPCDLTNPVQIEHTLDSVARQLDPAPAVLVNNAGWGGPFRRCDEIPDADWDAVFALHVRAPFLLCKKLLPAMQRANFGRIINVASIYGIAGGAGSSAYAASKHALVGFSKSLALEWAAWNITCNVLSPGFTDTAMHAHAGETLEKSKLDLIPAGRQAQAWEIARVVAFLAKPESAYINGANIVVDGGVTAGFTLPAR